MFGAVSENVCNLDALYANEFNYPTQRAMLETFFDGKAYDHKTSYSPQERENLEADINAIYNKICGNAKRSSTPVATVTAGSPGTGKTTVMRQTLESEDSRGAYICPDDVCLKNMPLTYGTELAHRTKELAKTIFSSDEEAQKALKDLRQELYTKWRPGSNAATHAILGNLIQGKYDIFFGTTSSSPFTANFFQFFKDQGYKIRVLHISAPDEVRWGSIQERDKTFVQTTEQDVREKGDLVPQRIQDTYLKLADEIQFFHRAGVKQEAVLAATWIRGTGSEKPELTIHDVQRYGEIRKIHDAVCDKLKRPDILWEKVVDQASNLCEKEKGFFEKIRCCRF